MRIEEIAPGLRLWTGKHPDWTPEAGGPEGWEQEVGCVYYRAPEEVVLIDPLVPAEDPRRFWRTLDAAVERDGRPVRVLLSVYWHGRNASEIASRYGGSIWADPESARVGGIPASAELPVGVEVYPTARGSEVVFWIPEHRALVPGDVIQAIGTRLRLCPASWLPPGVDHAQLRESLRPLLELPVERVLVSHGEPLLANARDELARIIAA